MERNQTMHSQAASLVVLEKDRLRVYPLDRKEKWLVGRETQNHHPDIPLRSRIVSRIHGWMMGVEGDWYYVDNPENLNGTYLNGSLICRPVSGTRKPITLRSGDVLRIDGEEEAADRNVVAMLYTTRPVQGSWKQYFLQEGMLVTMGSGSGCTLRFPGGAVVQAKITELNGRFYLSDCAGGTTLNGNILECPAVLRSGDCICADNNVCFFMGDRIIYEG